MAKSTIVGTDTVYAALVTRCNANFTELYNMLTGVAASTLLTPTIASFANATHDHADDAGGGATIAPAAITVASAVNLGTPSGHWTETGTCSYLKDPMGFVHLNGFVAVVGGATAAEIYDASNGLGAGYRPSEDIYCLAGFNASYDALYVIIKTTGAIESQSGADSTYIFFNSVAPFKAA